MLRVLRGAVPSRVRAASASSLGGVDVPPAHSLDDRPPRPLRNPPAAPAWPPTTLGSEPNAGRQRHPDTSPAAGDARGQSIRVGPRKVLQADARAHPSAWPVPPTPPSPTTGGRRAEVRGRAAQAEPLVPTRPRRRRACRARPLHPARPAAGGQIRALGPQGSLSGRRARGPKPWPGEGRATRRRLDRGTWDGSQRPCASVALPWLGGSFRSRTTFTPPPHPLGFESRVGKTLTLHRRERKWPN